MRISIGENMAEKTKIKKLKPKGFVQYIKRNWMLYLFLVPFVGGILLFKYYPMVGIQLAFKDWNMWKGIWGSPWAAIDGEKDVFKYFKIIFTDSEFIRKLLNTLRISSLKLLFGFPVPIFLTIFMNEMRSKKFRTIIQILLYLPYFISWVIIAGILKQITATGGALQAGLKSIFGQELQFFSNGDLFLFVLIFSDIWKNAGWETIIYLAAINAISPELYEAASIDGANRRQKITHVTLPGLLPAISINIIFKASGLMSAGFDQIFNLYNTAVYSVADVLETYSYRIGIGGAQYPLATAMGLFNSLVGFVLILIANFTVKKIGGTAIW